MKNFIIEGMDRCGKTTLISKLPELMSKTNPIISTHFQKIQFDESVDSKVLINYNKTLYESMFNSISYMNDTGLQIIMDRSHISEYVYGQLYRNYDSTYALSTVEFNMDFAKISEKTTLIVLVDNPIGIINRDDGKSNSIDITMLKCEYDLFLFAFKKTSIKKKIFINIHDKTEDDVYELIKRHQLAQFNNKGDIF